MPREIDGFYHDKMYINVLSISLGICDSYVIIIINFEALLIGFVNHDDGIALS